MNQQPAPNGAAALPRGGARQKVTFEVNVPVTVRLEFDPPAEPREGIYGPQYMYFLQGDRIMFADPPLHQAIRAKHAAAGATLIICKRKQGRSNVWEVHRPGEATIEPPAPPRSIAPPPIRAGNEEIGASGNVMAAALRDAIQACKLAGFAASNEDIRALAITIYIAVTGGKGGAR